MLKDGPVIPLEARKKLETFELDGEFITIQLRGNSTKTIKIKVDITIEVKAQLISCLERNKSLFVGINAKMSGIDLEVTCHQLSLNSSAHLCGTTSWEYIYSDYNQTFSFINLIVHEQGATK